ncbi:hypothetical protein [Streptomyces sp. NPDC057889]|uniref:hypothetical protein n=1 Tax=unclassified Streptomyces TaxID=2593676 RepID=UPI0036775001
MPARRTYPDELREHAIREVRSTDRRIAHVERDLGKEALRGTAGPRWTPASAMTA